MKAMLARHIVIDARIRRSSTGRYLDRLVEHLQDIDDYHRYTILVEPDDTWKMRAKNFRTLPCPFPQFSFNPLHDLRFSRMLYGLKPDLVHFGMTQQPLLYFGNIVTTTHDLTMFYFVRRGETAAATHWLKMRLYRFLMWWSHRKSKKIIVPTNTVAKEVAEFQPFTKKKLVVTYEAVGVPAKIAPKQPPWIKNDPFILYLGTAFPHKNLPTLVEAFDILHKADPSLKLIFVGKTEKHYEELEQQTASHPSAKSIRFTGFLPDEEAKWLYNHCRVFVQPSLSEGWGLPVLEAMANGAPVVSSDASVMPEVAGDAALYCDARNPKDIAEKVTKVLHSEKLRKELIEAGAKQVKKYSWHKMAEETLIVYKELLEN
jgi:glycosyltransferase involved in cell wall biosynthesis